LGVSDRHHFGWLVDALQAFEAESGALAALGRGTAAPVVWSLGAHAVDPPTAFLRDALGARAQVRLFDRFPSHAGVERQDLNALDQLPADACDVLAVFRASYFIAPPAPFLASARRLLRPGGLLVVDWLHGLSDAPVLDLRGDPRYGGESTPFMTTYVDPQALAECDTAFDELIAHVNRPPAWVDTARPGARVPLVTRVRRALDRRRGTLTRDRYAEACRDALERAGKHLIEPPLMEHYFKVLFRHARYFYRTVGKFNLYLLTVLQPVGR
jgi:SAM-dependent methyltransferase